MRRNIAASVRGRLLNLSRERGEDFNFILTQYAIQRLLYRLSISEFRDQFLLKGAWLFTIWDKAPHRPTRDADFLGFGPNDVDTLVQTFKSICAIEVADGLAFDLDSIRGMEIKEDDIYQGVRLNAYAYLDGARIALQADIGFGDTVTPAAEEAELPVFLDLPAPKLRVYPVYTVIAEKFQAMVALGLANTRMKDFYDVRRIAQMMSIDGCLLQQAVDATFRRRATVLDTQPLLIFSHSFRLDETKQKQWKAFLNRNGLEAGLDLETLIEQLRVFIEPVYLAIAKNRTWHRVWSPEHWQWMSR